TLLVLAQTCRLSSGLAPLREPVCGWEVATGREALSGVVRGVHTAGAVFSPDSQLLALPGAGKLRDVRSGGERPLEGGPVGRAPPLAFSPDGRLLAAMDPGRSNGPGMGVRVHEALTGQELARVRAALGYCPALAFSPDGRLLAAPGSDALHVWEPSTGRLLLHLPARGRLTGWTATGFATCLGVAPDGGAVATR